MHSYADTHAIILSYRGTTRFIHTNSRETKNRQNQKPLIETEKQKLYFK